MFESCWRNVSSELWQFRLPRFASVFRRIHQTLLVPSIWCLFRLLSGANRQQSKEIRHRPKRTTPEWSHAAVACMADIQPNALGTCCHPGSETSVGLPGQQKLYVRRSHMRPEPHHDELHTFRRETEPRRHCRNEGWMSHCSHDMMMIWCLRQWK